MPLSRDITDFHRLIVLRSRAEKAQTLSEYDGYCELYSLAHYLRGGYQDKQWDFPDVATLDLNV